MKVTLDEIKQIFDDLIKERKSREETSDWAILRQDAEDNEDLEYDPPKKEEIIWRAISYLTGVDLLDLEGNYLHSIDNFIDFKKELNI